MTSQSNHNDSTQLKQSEKKEKSMDDDYSAVPKPPDGGWGWMVVLGSFIIHIIADGMAYSFGVLMVTLLDQFEGVGRAQMGWIGSIMVGLTMGVGPIASILESKFGCRVVTILGTFICAFGFFISIWAPNVYFMYISFGVIGGTGLGLIYLPAITCVSYYFEKKRAFATGLAVCGSGLGTFIFAPIINFCLSEYGWQGTVLIQSGLLLNCCVSGMLFRPLEAPRQKRKPAQNSDSTKPLLAINGAASLEECPKTRLQELRNEPSMTNSLHNIHSSTEKKSPELRHRSVEHLHRQMSTEHDNKHSRPHVAHRKDAFYTASLENLALYRSDPDMYTASMTRLNTDAPHEHADQQAGNDEGDSNPCPCCVCISLQKRRSFSETMDFSLFKDIFFELFAWSNFLTNFAFFIPFMFLPDRAVLEGESTDRGALLLSVVGIFNTAGRILFGFAADRLYNRLYLYNTVLALCGVVTCLSAHFPGYWCLAAYAAAYGLLVGVYVTLTPVIIVDLLGLEKLSNAFGWVLLFQGVASGLGPPIAGWCFDVTGDYFLALWLVGVMMAVSGIMLYPIPCIGRALGKPWRVNQTEAEMNGDVGKSVDYKVVSQTAENGV